MEFNLLDLHDSKEDVNVRKLLRVYSVIPRFSKKSKGEKAEQAIKIVKFLRKTNEKLKKEISPSWKNEWMKSTGYPFAKYTCKDWFVGRSSIPLIALKRLETFGFGTEVRTLIDNSNFFCSTSGKVFKLPHRITAELAYLLGAILGDGHIKKIDDRIYFEVTEKWLARKFIQKIANSFNHKLPMKSRIDRGKVRCRVSCNNKPAVRMFTKFLGVPRSKKSHKIVVSDVIKKSPIEIQLAFLEGVFDTDGCIRKKGFRLTTASKQFRDDLSQLLVSLGERGWKDEWINKKYNKKYYGLQYSIGNIPFLAGMPELVKRTGFRK